MSCILHSTQFFEMDVWKFEKYEKYIIIIIIIITIIMQNYTYLKKI